VHRRADFVLRFFVASGYRRNNVSVPGTISLPPLPDMHAIAVLLLTGVAVYVYARDMLPAETTSLLVLVALALGFYVFPYPGLEPQQFLRAFGDEALITICALLVASQAVEVTGALQPLSRLMAAGWQDSPRRSFLIVLLAGAFISAFLNNTPIVVMTMPILIAVCLRTGTSPSTVLMPMGFAVIFGANMSFATPIGYQTNLLIMSAGGYRWSDFARVGIPRSSCGSRFRLFCRSCTIFDLRRLHQRPL